MTMRVALVANTDWLEEELAVYHHLVVGLIDEQVHVVQVVPEGFPLEQTNSFCERVTWRDSRFRWTQRMRLAWLHTRLADLGVDLIHALDARLWDATLHLASRVGVPVVLTASRSSDVDLVNRLEKQLDINRVAFTAATEPIGHAIRKSLGQQASVDLVPPGIMAPDSTRSQPRDEQPLCAVVSGDGQFDADYEALLIAMGDVVARHPDAQFFFDGQGADQQRIWQFARRNQLLSNLSIMPRRSGLRDLLLSADALIHPQALGRARSIMLQAMARGLPVLAREDPWLDFLIDDETVWLVQHSSPDDWRQLLLRLIDDRPRASVLGQRARNWVRQHNPASSLVSRMLDIYRRCTGETMKFPT